MGAGGGHRESGVVELGAVLVVGDGEPASVSSGHSMTSSLDRVPTSTEGGFSAVAATVRACGPWRGRVWPR